MIHQKRTKLSKNVFKSKKVLQYFDPEALNNYLFFKSEASNALAIGAPGATIGNTLSS